MLAWPVSTIFSAVLLLAPLLALAFPPGGNLALVGAGTAIAVASLLLIRGRLEHEVLFAVGALLQVLGIAVIRHAEGGGVSGLSPLYLVPLFWAALTGRRRDVALVVAGLALALVLPIVLVGEPAYGAGEWRRAVVWLSVAPIVGLATVGLVSRVREANAGLEELARTDALTGLVNRRGFDELAHREVLRVRRTGEPLVIAIVDVDHFKRWNDTHGHAEGDRLLVAAARAWQAELREIDVLGRWGGEEFVVLLPRCPEAVAQNVLDRLRAATPEGQTCSIGFARLGAQESAADALVRADLALYQAKADGRDRVQSA